MTPRQLSIAELKEHIGKMQTELDLLERAETLERAPLKIGDVIRWRKAPRKPWRRGRVVDVDRWGGDLGFNYYVIRIRSNGTDGGRERVPGYRKSERIEVQE